MTYEEALDKVANLAVTYSQIDADTCKLFAIAKKAIEKQIRKKVIWRFGGDGLPYPYCSACGKSVMRSDYCDNCGQKLEW